MAAFFFDNDADLRIGRWLQAHGHAVLSTHDIAALEVATDKEILLYAGPAGLIVVTHNERHFVRLHQVGAVPHAGILTMPQVGPDGVSTMGERVDWLVCSGQPMANALYRFKAAKVWERWDEKHGWTTL